jgi:hypothetical protein
VVKTKAKPGQYMGHPVTANHAEFGRRLRTHLSPAVVKLCGLQGFTVTSPLK